MDTRSVIRSRRQSARLNNQSRDNKSAKPSKTDTRVSNTRATTKTSHMPMTSTAPTTKRVDVADTSTKASYTGILQPSSAAKGSTEKGERVTMSPEFPNLRLFNKTQAGHNNTRKGTPLAEVLENIGAGGQGGRVGARQTPDSSRSTITSTEKSRAVRASSQSDTLRRSAILASSTPAPEDLATPATSANSKTMQPSAKKKRDTAVLAFLKDDTGAGAEASTPVATDPPRRLPHRVVVVDSSSSSLTDIDELSSHDELSLADDSDEVELAEKTSPIPELVADIGRIIENSSAIVLRASSEASAFVGAFTSATALDGTRGANNSTEAVKEADVDPSIVQTTINNSATFGFTPNATSQSGGGSTAPGNTNSRFQVASSEALTASHHQRDSADSPRGIKRRAEEMSDVEQVHVRKQQLEATDHLSTVVQGTVNLIESASSRDCYDDVDVEMFNMDGNIWLDGVTGEPARATGLLEEVHSQSGPKSTAEHYYTASQQAEALPLHLHDISKCGDCGKVPKRFLVCTKCLKTRYCGKYCQIWNWPVHKRVCAASEEADPDEIKKQEVYLEGMWTGALGALEGEVVNPVVNPAAKTDGGIEEQDAFQSTIDTRLKGNVVSENIVEQGIRLLRGGEPVSGQDGAGQQGDGVGESLMQKMEDAEDSAGDEVEEEEESSIFKMPPPSPESMFESRALALRLAKGEQG